MTPDSIRHALRSERIEAVPKHAKRLPTFRNHTGKDVRIGEDYTAFLQHVRVGRPLPRHYYRAGLGKDVAHLLDLVGIKHLHLGPWDLGVLLYVLETQDSVILLELNGHQHARRTQRFDAEAIGRGLLAVHRAALDRECRLLDFPPKRAA